MWYIDSHIVTHSYRWFGSDIYLISFMGQSSNLKLFPTESRHWLRNLLCALMKSHYFTWSEGESTRIPMRSSQSNILACVFNFAVTQKAASLIVQCVILETLLWICQGKISKVLMDLLPPRTRMYYYNVAFGKHPGTQEKTSQTGCSQTSVTRRRLIRISSLHQVDKN